MKVFLLLMSLAFLYCGCERHSAEGHEKADGSADHDVKATEKSEYQAPAHEEQVPKKSGH